MTGISGVGKTRPRLLKRVRIKTPNERKQNRENLLKALNNGYYFECVVRFINRYQVKYDDAFFFSILFTRWESR